MLRAEVTGNAIEISLPRSDVALLALSALMLAGLIALAGWRVAVVALGLSIAGAWSVGAAQSWGASAGPRREPRHAGPESR
jgi:hypothetical protein